MRHSRRAVMAERYKLYAKKNIFNGRYFVRNVQIGLVAVVLVAIIIGTVILTSGTKEEVVAANAKVSVKEALFGSSEEAKPVVKEDTTEKTTEAQNNAITEKVQEEFDSTITEVANNVTNKVEKNEQQQQEEQPKSEFDNKCIANVEETLNVRKDPSTDAEFVGSMNPGAIATIEGTEGEWTKIKSGDVEGYVLTEYILTGESAEQLAKDYVTFQGTVLEDGVNVRSEKSIDAEILTVMDKNDTLTVLEDSEEKEDILEGAATDETEEQENIIVVEAERAVTESTEAAKTVVNEVVTIENNTENIEWISVMLEDGQTGYVAAEFVEVDELYEIAVSAEELQRRAEEEAARQAAEEEAARLAAEEAARQAARQAATTQQTNNTSNSSSSDTTDNYQGATTKPVTATESGEYIGTFTITAYCGCKKCSGGHNKTASGTTPTEGRTIAADTSILPFGTQVVIDGIVYTVEDRGSGVNGNHIDIFFATHEKALTFGRKTIKVYKY